MKKFTLTKKQHEKDSEVMGGIIAGVKTRKKPLKLAVSAMETTQSMCAIGAGNRGRKVTQASDILTKTSGTSSKKQQLIPLIRFSTINSVSEDYACGVNDGFEDDTNAARHFYHEIDRDSLDYLRGWHVGQAVRIDAGFN